ncbi:MAG: hypothetical protein Q8R25_02725 [bacterium]|nr:hypothetical protein [bacterium]
MSIISLIAELMPRKASQLKSFRYKYLRHPFDNWQYFSVEAEDQTNADKAAIERFTDLFNNHFTTMTTFHSA